MKSKFFQALSITESMKDLMLLLLNIVNDGHFGTVEWGMHLPQLPHYLLLRISFSCHMHSCDVHQLLMQTTAASSTVVRFDFKWM